MSYFYQKSITLIRISVIIVNYNARYFLKNCIHSILSSDMMNEIEIIIVDNASTDGSCEMLGTDFPDIQCIANDENIGFGKANNQGVKLAHGDYILILNPDTMLAENTLSKAIEFAENQNSFGALGVHFIDGAGKYLPESKRNFPNLKVAGAKLVGYSKFYYANDIAQNDVTEVEVLTGAFMFIKKEVYNRIHGFDEDFFMYGEDIDLSYRIFKAGFKNFYLGTSKVLHFKGESTIKDKFYLRNFYGALGIFYKKHFPDRVVLAHIVDALIQVIITIKSALGTRKVSEVLVVKDWVYVGKNKKLFDRLKTLFSDPKAVALKEVEEAISNHQVVFFDSKELASSHIIKAISNPEFDQVKKRIISEDHRFYLGSDSSNTRGEVVHI